MAKRKSQDLADTADSLSGPAVNMLDHQTDDHILKRQSAHLRLPQQYHDGRTATLPEEKQEDRRQPRNVIQLPAPFSRISKPVSTIAATLACLLNRQITHPPPQSKLPFPVASLSREAMYQQVSLHDQYRHGLQDTLYGMPVPSKHPAYKLPSLLWYKEEQSRQYYPQNDHQYPYWPLPHSFDSTESAFTHRLSLAQSLPGELPGSQEEWGTQHDYEDYHSPSGSQFPSTLLQRPIDDATSQSAQSQPAPQTINENNTSSRAAKDRARLEAVNGVATPSKVAVGELPFRPRSRVKSDQLLDRICPICGAGFYINTHLKSHFTSCAVRNGNPVGAHWNEYIQGWMTRRGSSRLPVADREDGSSTLVAEYAGPHTKREPHAEAESHEEAKSHEDDEPYRVDESHKVDESQKVDDLLRTAPLSRQGSNRSRSLSPWGVYD